MKLLRLIMSALALSTPGLLSKETEHPPKQANFQKRLLALDSDRSGTVSLEEFQLNPRLERATPEQRKKLFQRFDKNSDGQIQSSEIQRPHHKKNHPPFDWKAHGPVNFKEFTALPRISKLPVNMQERLFKRLDRNADGIVDKQDIRKNKGHREPSRRLLKERFKKLDTNQDQSLSFDEFFAAPFSQKLGEDRAEILFEKIDKNNDTILSSEEYSRSNRSKH